MAGKLKRKPLNEAQQLALMKIRLTYGIVRSRNGITAVKEASLVSQEAKELAEQIDEKLDELILLIKGTSL